MTGGLLQLVTSGKQDIYLTINPEITFFKKVYRRHTNFSTELQTISAEQQPRYNNIVSFIINSQGDALHRCYLEITLPVLSFSDIYITDPNYINKKATDIGNLNTLIQLWTSYYTNLKNFVDIELGLYRQLKVLLNTDNITINILKTTTSQFNTINKIAKDQYINKIDASVYNLINISGYINNINKLITNDTTLDPNTYILRTQIISDIDKQYNNMVYYLNLYNNRVNLYKTRYNNMTSKTNTINFNYADFLGHNFFDYFTIEIGGNELERYPKDHLHISQMHHIKQDYMQNYMNMIGYTPELNTFNTNTKGGQKIIVPLIFWFNKNSGASLPIVALQYPTITINAKISNISNIICLQHYAKMFTELLNVTTYYDNTGKVIINKKLIYSSYNVDIANMAINYNCIYINNELLQIVYPDLTTDEINTILVNNGSMVTLNQVTQFMNPNMSYDTIVKNTGINGTTTQYIMNMNQWIVFMNNIKNPTYNTIAPKVASYYPYIDNNLYLSLVPQPTIQLVGEFIYMDDVERSKFSDSKLEYIIETYDEDLYTINNNMAVYNCELSFTKPCKELIWYIQPNLFINGLSSYGQNTSLIFDSSAYFVNNMIQDQILQLNGLDVLFNFVDNNYYTYLLSWKYLNNILPNGLFYHSFSLYPEESQPSGTVNMREIKGKQYMVQFNPNFLNEYYKSKLNSNGSPLILKFMSKTYDLFVVHKGFCKLLFSL